VTPRLWVTGAGLSTPLGDGLEATWQRLIRGDRAFAPVSLFDATQQSGRVAAEVRGVRFPPEAREVQAWSRTSAMACVAAREAMAMARVTPGRQRVGLVVGGTTGGMFETEELLARLHADPGCRDTLAQMLSHPLTATGDRLDETLGPFARVRTISSACSSGANALVVAASWLLAGEVDLVVAGASDALCRLTLSGFNALAAIDREGCRPFHRQRRGISLGEGAGFVVLERAAEAQARGAEPIAALAGWALGSEAHHITNPAADGALVASLVERALASADLTPADIDYVNAHGTGTVLNDRMEAAALARALGTEVSRIPVSSSKGQIGHTLGAAGAIEAVITALVVSRRTLVPTAGLSDPDPALGLVHVPHAGRRVPRVRAALSNAFGFGGMDTVLAFSEPRASVAAVARRRRDVVVTGAAVVGPGGLRGVEGCATLPEQERSRAAADPDAHLDSGRARRMDLAARLAAVVTQSVLAESGASAANTGLVLGSSFGNVDASAGFMHKIFERGPRFASPAEFPNLVPSAAVGHGSIYCGLRGPAFATADLETSGECAFVQAAQMVAGGEAARMVAGATEPRSAIVEGVLGALFSRTPSRVGMQRDDLAAAVLVEAEDEARRRGAAVLARVAAWDEWRGDLRGARLPPPPRTPRACVVLARPDDDLERFVERAGWGACPRWVCVRAVGESDALGAVAIAVAAARVGTRRASEALLVGVARGRGYAIVLAEP